MPRMTLLDANGAEHHYDPNQPRDWHGRWTDTGSGRPPASHTGVPAHSPTQPGIVMSRKCREEWDYASNKCHELKARGRLTRSSPYGSNWDKCVLGLVSFACGGNPVG